MGGIVMMLLIVVIVVVLPIALFFGVIGLTLTIWCWRRIGPYFVNFGRWLANWQNLVPCSCLGCGSLIFLLVVAPLLLPHSLGILRLMGLILLAVIALICGIFVLIILTVRLLQWLWPRFRRWFWQFPPRLGNLLWKRLPDMVETKMPGGSPKGQKKLPSKPTANTESTTGEPMAKPLTQAMPPERHSWLDMAWLWSILWGKPQQPARKRPTAASPTEANGTGDVKPPASVQPSRKRSWLSISSLWSMLWGKPQQPVKKKPKAGPVLSETQSQVVISTPQEAKARVAEKPRTGLRPLTWRLGLFVSGLKRRMQRMWGKPAPPGKKTMGAQNRPNAPAAPLASQSTPSVAVPGIKTQQAKEKPSKGASNGLMAAVNFVRKRFWLAIFWVVERVRTGVDFMLRLLHLNGRKNEKP